jgi:hypothetical protein
VVGVASLTTIDRKPLVFACFLRKLIRTKRKLTTRSPKNKRTAKIQLRMTATRKKPQNQNMILRLKAKTTMVQNMVMRTVET